MSQAQVDVAGTDAAQVPTIHRGPGQESPCPSSSIHRGVVVVLNGFPGTGKLTIMKRIQQLLPPNTTYLLDNHLLIDPVVTVIPNRNVEHHELRRAVRRPIFQALNKRAREGHVILMTACLAANNETDAAFMEEHIDIVRGTGVPLIWVNAHCDQRVLEQRLQSQERILYSKTKLTDVRVLEDIILKHCLIVPDIDVRKKLANLVVESMDASGPIEESVDCLLKMVGTSLQGS